MANGQKNAKRNSIMGAPNEDLLSVMTEAVGRAVSATLEAGHWTSHIEDGNIVHIYPDGSRVVDRPLTTR